MPVSCEICGIKTRRVGDNKRVFMAKFPLDEERCKQWVKVTGKEDLAYVPIEKLHQLKYLCENHFQTKDFKKKKTQLKKTAIPSLEISSTPLSDEILVDFPLHCFGSSPKLPAKRTNNVQHSYSEPSSPTPPTDIGLELDCSTEPLKPKVDGPGLVKKRKSRSQGGPVKKAKTTRLPARKVQVVAKRARNKTISPRGERKRPRRDQSKRVAKSCAKAASLSLNVMITCKRTGIISEGVSNQVLADIQKKIISEAFSPKRNSRGPTFNGKPLYTGGVLNLWCGNEHTLSWLKRTVSGLTVPAGTSLVVRSQADNQKLVRCGIAIPDDQGVYDSRNIGRALSYQNPWVDVKRWVLLLAAKQEAGWFLVLGIPEDQISTLMRAERRLSLGLGSVDVKFQGLNGWFVDVPRGWERATDHTQEAGDSLPPSNNLAALAVGPAIKVEPAAAVAVVDVDPLSGGEGFDEGNLFAGLRLKVEEEGFTCNGVPFVGP